jgi:hypothetical protein
MRNAATSIRRFSISFIGSNLPTRRHYFRLPATREQNRHARGGSRLFSLRWTGCRRGEILIEATPSGCDG